MYAVIETGGKQYRVELGTELAVERLDATPGSSIDFDRVLLVADGDSAEVGTPTVADALVTADVLRQDRGDKVIVFKYRPKARHRSKKGHRQEQTVIRVADIRFNGRSAADEAGKADSSQKAARKAAQAEAEQKATADQELAAKLAADAEKATATAAEEPKTQKSTAKSKATQTNAAPETTAARKRTAKADAPEAPEAPAEAPAASDEAPAAESKKTTRPRSTRTSTKKDE